MITLRQLEALYWIHRLGTFERAASKLNTSQSAISKRIRELEESSGLPLFTRGQRGARLTEKGEQLLAIGEEMLELQDRILELKNNREMPAHRLRFGVTELTALTWLPRFVEAVHKKYPKVVLEPYVDSGYALLDKLRDEAVDLIVMPENLAYEEISSVRLAEVANAWMAKPGVIGPDASLALNELTQLTVLAQSPRGGTGQFYARWFRGQGIEFSNLILCDNLIALLGLTMAGVGVGYLPRQCFRSLVKDGKLEIVSAQPALPSVPYSIMYRGQDLSFFLSEIVDLMADTCDYTRQLYA